MSDDAALGTFLRARRERLTPAEVGLATSPRRRTPGLRREELATLAGVSIDYLIRLEQGRDTRPSPGVQAALAKALQLSDDERTHMFHLAAHNISGPLCPSNAPPSPAVAPTVVQMLDGLARTPAFVAGPQNDVLAWNASWELVAGPMAMLDGDPPNLARHVFLNPSASSVYPDWALAADEQASRLRAASARWSDNPVFAALIDELSAGSEQFALRWATHDVAEKHRGIKRLVHPAAGEIRVAYEVLLLPDDNEQRLISWLPADEQSVAVMSRLLSVGEPVSPARLRVVGAN
jgi:transcriptional regulator with XRE-family HTH domain